MLDKISAESWAEVLQRDIDLFRPQFKKWDGLLFRLDMYGSTYFIFSIFVAAIGAFGSREFLELFELTSDERISGFVGIIFPATVFGYIVYQMLTIKSRFGTSFFLGIILVLLLLLFY